ncbi:MAG: SDR family oxidoreductase [Pseudomonadota bacterium]
MSDNPSTGVEPRPLDEQVVLLLGGTSGIGLAIARAFQAEGADVTVVGATQAEADQITDMAAFAVDVTDASAVAALIGRFDTLTHVVNCAGIIRRGEELEPDTFARVLDVNLTGTMRVCAAARPLLAQTRGTITNTASMLSYFGGALVPGYAASKGGISQLTKSLALAYGPDGIRVNAVAPGWIATPLTQALQDDPTRSAAILGRTALNRWGQPEDIAGGVMYLASPLAAYVTGTILPIDGGYLAG